MFTVHYLPNRGVLRISINVITTDTAAKCKHYHIVESQQVLFTSKFSQIKVLLYLQVTAKSVKFTYHGYFRMYSISIEMNVYNGMNVMFYHINYHFTKIFSDVLLLIPLQLLFQIMLRKNCYSRLKIT